MKTFFQTQEIFKLGFQKHRTIKRPFRDGRSPDEFSRLRISSKWLSENEDLQKVYQRSEIFKGGFYRKISSKTFPETWDLKNVCQILNTFEWVFPVRVDFQKGFRAHRGLSTDLSETRRLQRRFWDPKGVSNTKDYHKASIMAGDLQMSFRNTEDFQNDFQRMKTFE